LFYVVKVVGSSLFVVNEASELVRLDLEGLVADFEQQTSHSKPTVVVKSVRGFDVFEPNGGGQKSDSSVWTISDKGHVQCVSTGARRQPLLDTTMPKSSGSTTFHAIAAGKDFAVTAAYDGSSDNNVYQCLAAADKLEVVKTELTRKNDGGSSSRLLM